MGGLRCWYEYPLLQLKHQCAGSPGELNQVVRLLYSRERSSLSSRRSFSFIWVRTGTLQRIQRKWAQNHLYRLQINYSGQREIRGCWDDHELPSLCLVSPERRRCVVWRGLFSSCWNSNWECTDMPLSGRQLVSGFHEIVSRCNTWKTLSFVENEANDSVNSRRTNWSGFTCNFSKRPNSECIVMFWIRCLSPHTANCKKSSCTSTDWQVLCKDKNWNSVEALLM